MYIKPVRWIRYASTVAGRAKIQPSFAKYQDILTAGIDAAGQSSASSSGILTQCRVAPGLFEGIHTDYGWGVIPLGLSQKEKLPGLNGFLSTTFALAKPKPLELQLAIDKWLVEETRLNGIALSRVIRRSKKPVEIKLPPKKEATLMQAMFYFFAVNYSKVETLSKRTARSELAQLWHALSDAEKEFLRDEVAALHNTGKTVYRNKIITIEEKEKLTKKKQL